MNNSSPEPSFFSTNGTLLNLGNDDSGVQLGLAIAAGVAAVLITASIMLLIMLARQRHLQKQLDSMSPEALALKAGVWDKKRTNNDVNNALEPFKKHLLQSAFDLQSRLSNQVNANFLYEFYQRSDRDREYAAYSTAYFFAEFLGWLEVVRQRTVFVTGSEYAEQLNCLIESMKFQFTGETPIQGCAPKNFDWSAGSDFYDAEASAMQLYIVDIRSIGNAMLVKHGEDDFAKPMSCDEFIRRVASEHFPSARELSGEASTSSAAAARPRTSALEQNRANETDEAAVNLLFQRTMMPLTDAINNLASLPAKRSPKKRLAMFQVLLCKLIDILDAAVPWDLGPKFDADEEPRYIQRDIRLTPGVKHLSPLQIQNLSQQNFFASSDPNVSFPGFREDLAPKAQHERDDALWLGACPPREPRMRDARWLQQFRYSQGMTPGMGGSGVRRRRNTQRTFDGGNQAPAEANTVPGTRAPSASAAVAQDKNPMLKLIAQRLADQKAAGGGDGKDPDERDRRKSMQASRSVTLKLPPDYDDEDGDAGGGAARGAGAASRRHDVEDPLSPPERRGGDKGASRTTPDHASEPFAESRPPLRKPSMANAFRVAGGGGGAGGGGPGPQPAFMSDPSMRLVSFTAATPIYAASTAPSSRRESDSVPLLSIHEHVNNQIKSQLQSHFPNLYQAKKPPRGSQASTATRSSVVLPPPFSSPSRTSVPPPPPPQVPSPPPHTASHVPSHFTHAPATHGILHHAPPPPPQPPSPPPIADRPYIMHTSPSQQHATPPFDRPSVINSASSSQQLVSQADRPSYIAMSQLTPSSSGRVERIQDAGRGQPQRPDGTRGSVRSSSPGGGGIGGGGGSGSTAPVSRMVLPGQYSSTAEPPARKLSSAGSGSGIPLLQGDQSWTAGGVGQQQRGGSGEIHERSTPVVPFSNGKESMSERHNG